MFAIVSLFVIGEFSEALALQVAVFQGKAELHFGPQLRV
jgi:hypothetical protein